MPLGLCVTKGKSTAPAAFLRQLHLQPAEENDNEFDVKFLEMLDDVIPLLRLSKLPYEIEP